MNSLFKNLNPRERYSLIVGSSALLVFLVYILLWQPWQNQVQEMRLRVGEQVDELAWMQQAAKEAKQLRTAGTASVPNRPTASLFSIIDSSMAQTSLAKANKRIEPSTEQEIRISFEQANFSDLIQWIAGLKQQYHLQVQVITLERLAGNDSVKVQLTLKQ
ncbi:MAG: type II secretion system protein M [Thiotrichaceae bacterium]|nr:type II secretion system protein M [Thiotrichaceae bacterium]